MDDKFEIELSRTRDYKLIYNFYFCPTCEMEGKKYDVWCKTFIHRTQSEVDAGLTHNINAMCPERHVFKPQKHCSKCGAIYNHEKILCDVCEPICIEFVRNNYEKMSKV